MAPFHISKDSWPRLRVYINVYIGMHVGKDVDMFLGTISQLLLL